MNQPERNAKNEPISSVLDIFKACIKNGEEFKTICQRDANEAMKNNPMLKHLMQKTEEDMKAIEILAKKISNLKSNNLQSLKSELGDVINKLDAMSIENLTKIKEAVASSNTSKIRKKISENNETLTKLSEDEHIRNLASVLLDQNKKIVECLKYAHSLLPKFFGTPKKDEVKHGKRKLFIIGDDLNRLSSHIPQNLETIGEVTIHCDIDTSKTSADGQMPEYPERLNGYLQNENGEKTEVILKLKEPISFNLIDFSKEESKMSATISIPGEAEEKIEVVEINLSQQGPELLAVVQNDSGDVNEVRVQVVPISPDKNVHGKILEFQKITDEENIEDIHLDLMESSLMNSTMITSLPHYATPKRQQKPVLGANRYDAATLYGTAMRKSPRLERGLIDSINESIQMDQSVKEVQEILEPTIEKIIENMTNNLVNELLKNEVNLNDESELEYANISNRSLKNIDDISQIEFADISNVSKRSEAQSPLQTSIRNAERQFATPRPILMRQSPIVSSPIGNISDVSEIEYADISSRSFKTTPQTQQRSMYETPQRKPNLSIRETRSPSSRGVREGTLINFTPSPRARLHQENYSQRVDNFGGDLIDLGQHDNNMNQSSNNSPIVERHMHFNAQQVNRRKIPNELNRSMPLRQKVALNNFNRSLQEGVRYKNNQIQRPFAPVQLIPSRVPEDEPSDINIPEMNLIEQHQFSPLHYSDLMNIQPPFSDSFESLESKASEATQMNRTVNELRLMKNLEAQQPQEFASKFDASSLLEDVSFNDIDVTDASINATVVEPPPFFAQPAEEFAARFEMNNELLDDINLDDVNDVSITSPRRIRVITEPQAPSRQLKSNIPIRYQNKIEPKLLDFDD